MSGADAVLAAGKDLMDDLRDGIKFEVEVFEWKLPLVLRIDPREDGDE
jgi:hypothetical protein